MAQGIVHVLGVEELLFRILFVIHLVVIVVHTVGFRYHCIDEVSEVKSHFLVAELHPGVKQVLQLGKVGVAYFLSVVILVGIHIVYHNQSVL